MLTGILTQLLFRLLVIESSFLVSVLFREEFSHPYISFYRLLVNGFLDCLWMKKIFESYFSDRLTFSNINSRRIYRLALPLSAPEMLSSLSKSRVSVFNLHLTLFVHRKTSHNFIGKFSQFLVN